MIDHSIRLALHFLHHTRGQVIGRLPATPSGNHQDGKPMLIESLNQLRDALTGKLSDLPSLRQCLAVCYCQQRFRAFDRINSFTAGFGDALQFLSFPFPQGSKRNVW